MRMPSASEHFDGVSATVADARRFVRETLEAWHADEFEWTATIVVSELATNAVLHAGTSYSVTLTLRSEVLAIEVADSSTRLPTLRRYGSEATTGRGVRMVDQMCHSYRVEARTGGKVVRCEIRRRGGGLGMERFSPVDAAFPIDESPSTMQGWAV